MADSFLFYDLETFGQDPRRTRISQYAAIRTDADLNEIDTPVSFVRPADDLLPSPMATLVTGITPQQALAEGISEAEAFDRINEQLSRPGTCALAITRCALTMNSSATGCSAIPRPVRARVAQRQFALGPAGHAAPDARDASGRHRGAARGRRHLVRSSTWPRPTTCARAMRTKRCPTYVPPSAWHACSRSRSRACGSTR